MCKVRRSDSRDPAQDRRAGDGAPGCLLAGCPAISGKIPVSSNRRYCWSLAGRAIDDPRRQQAAAWTPETGPRPARTAAPRTARSRPSRATSKSDWTEPRTRAITYSRRELRSLRARRYASACMRAISQAFEAMHRPMTVARDFDTGASGQTIRPLFRPGRGPRTR